MARRANFFGTTIRLVKAIEADQRRAQNAAVRQHNALIRSQNALARQAGRDFKQAERERLAREKEGAIQYAAEKTLEAEEKRTALTALLKSAAKVPILVDWDTFKESDPFPTTPLNSPSLQTLPAKPDESKYSPKFGVLDWMFKSRKERTVRLANERFKEDINRWETLTTEIEQANEKATHDYNKKTAAWKLAKLEFENRHLEQNANLDRLAASFDRGDENAVEFFFDAVLQQLELPLEVELQWQLQYNKISKILIVDLDLPDISVVPSLRFMKYAPTRKEFTETFLKEKEIDQLYNEVLLQISLRVTNDLYVSDTTNKLMSVVFNGIFNGLSKSTGNEESRCIMSLQTKKTEFLEIKIENVDAKTCFLKFKGIAGNKLSEFVPISPVLAMDRADSRFVDGMDLSERVGGMNLASMDWESFEHLIRELFEKEFATNGAEVRITRGSRDGGVDAVMFDPDPIRGGKYVIQAKRYTNVVGVAAVRDLYGTLMNEGAVKGIMVTTANYGAESYEFAKDKPITLLNGSNLLHMLQKHGYQVRIDVEEAKRLMSDEK